MVRSFNTGASASYFVRNVVSTSTHTVSVILRLGPQCKRAIRKNIKHAALLNQNCGPTTKQRYYIYDLCERLRNPRPNTDGLSTMDASRMIDKLK